MQALYRLFSELSTTAKNHHYVWQHYLQPWVTNGTLFCYRQRENNLFKTGTKTIASETYFYKISHLTDEDKQYLETIINNVTSPIIRDMHIRVMNLFQRSFKIREILARRHSNGQDRLRDEARLDAIEKTLAEQFNASIEEHMLRPLAELHNKDCSFYRDAKQAAKFINFLTHQMFRTPKLKKLVPTLFNPIQGLDRKRTWLIESYIYSTNLGANIYSERDDYQFVFLENNSDVPFITSDQPVTNLKTHEDQELKLYYPLKPSLALIFEKNRGASRKIVRRCSKIETEFYNQRIYSDSYDQLYSNNREYLEHLSRGPKNLD